jgi:hypothetical protein
LAHGKQVGVNAIHVDKDFHTKSVIAQDENHVVARWEFLDELE